MKKITLFNFLRMAPDVPGYSDRNQHYYMSGVNPTYYLDSVGTQEEQVAPLIASNTWDTPLATLTDGSVVDVTQSTDATYEAFAIDATSNVYRITDTALTSSYPTGSAGAISTGSVKCFNGYLLATTTLNTNRFFRMPLPSGSWVTSSDSFAGITGFLETFLEYCMVVDVSAKIYKIDASFTKLTGINLGSGWSIKGMRNFNDKYLAIAASLDTFNNNFLFLWNGRADTYQYSIKMAGKFLDMKVIDGVLYIAIWMTGTGNSAGTGAGKTVLYYLNGTRLLPVLTTQISSMKNFGFKAELFNFANRVGMNLTNNDLLLYAKGIAGTEEFVVSTGINFTLFSETYKGKLLGIADKTLYYYNQNSTTFNPISYTSQWIPVKNLTGIDIEYDTPPQISGDTINTTLYGRGEDIISGNSTQVLDVITPATILNTTRTRLDVKGFTGDRAKIAITTTASTTWRPSIRNISLIVK